jgi:hypothetical protein
MNQPIGVWVKFYKHSNKRIYGGGMLMYNKSTEYIYLKNPYTNKKWPVAITDDVVFYVRDQSLVDAEKEQKQQLFDLYNQGKLVMKK